MGGKNGGWKGGREGDGKRRRVKAYRVAATNQRTPCSLSLCHPPAQVSSLPFEDGTVLH